MAQAEHCHSPKHNQECWQHRRERIQYCVQQLKKSGLCPEPVRNYTVEERNVDDHVDTETQEQELQRILHSINMQGMRAKVRGS